jgi:hypothetical protein
MNKAKQAVKAKLDTAVQTLRTVSSGLLALSIIATYSVVRVTAAKNQGSSAKNTALCSDADGAVSNIVVASCRHGGRLWFGSKP